MIATIPHGGRVIPDEYARSLAVPADELWADWYTSELYDFLADVGVTSVCTDLSRFVADPNRDPTSGHGDFWKAVVPDTDPMGAAIYRASLTEGEIERRIALAHQPFHDLLDGELETMLCEHPRVLLLDLHSFGVPLDVDVVLGDGHGSAARPSVVKIVDDAVTGAGFMTARNLRFPGGWIVRRFIDCDRVDAIAVELNQRCYLDPAAVDAWPNVPTLDPPRLAEMQGRLSAAILNVVERLVSATPQNTSVRPATVAL